MSDLVGNPEDRMWHIISPTNNGDGQNGRMPARAHILFNCFTLPVNVRMCDSVGSKRGSIGRVKEIEQNHINGCVA